MIMIKGTNNATKNEIKSKFVEISGLKLSWEIIFPTNMLDWNVWLGKNNNPDINPDIIEILASLKSNFLFIKP